MSQFYENILYWIDAEGFGNVTNFHAKEFFVYNNERKTETLYYFKILDNDDSLAIQNHPSSLFLTRNTHGMNFIDEHTDLPQTDFKRMIQKLCYEAKLKNKFIAYKGCAHIYHIIEDFGFGDVGVNIEDFNCLRYSNIIKNHKWIHNKHVNKRCSRHNFLNNGQRGQCSQMKVHIYMEFLHHVSHNHQNYKAIGPVNQFL